MIEQAALLKSAAGQIDTLDAEIAGLNDSKKDIFGNIRETVSPADFKAWRDAVKLRQKRRVDKEALEAHDERVWAMLSMLEAETVQPPQDRGVDPVSAPAIAIVGETAPTRTHAHVAHEGKLPYDPETGEIVPHTSEPPVSGGDGGHPTDENETGNPVGSEAVHAPGKLPDPADYSEMPDLPAHLDRRRRAA